MTLVLFRLQDCGAFAIVVPNLPAMVWNGNKIQVVHRLKT